MKSNSLTVFNQNIQHLNSRKESLEIVLEEIKPNIVLLTEHNMSKNELERFNLENFLLTAEYSRTTTSGGGVVIFSERGLKAKPLKLKILDSLTEDKLFECCIAKYCIENWKFILVGIYRKPQLQTLEFLNRLDKLFESLTSLKDVDNFVVGGDFNIDVLSSKSEVRDFKNVLECHGCSYLIDFPTRVALNSATAIDNFVTNLDKSITKVTGIITALSDHDGQVLDIKANVSLKKERKYQYVERRDFSDSNMDIFCNLLSRESWVPMYQAKIEDKFSVFENIFHYYFSLVFPKKKVKKCVMGNEYSWINSELLADHNRIVELTKQAKHTGNNDLLHYCKLLNNEYKSKLIQRKKNYYDEQIRNSDNICKKSWEIINRETGKPSKLKNLITEVRKDNIVIEDPSKISNLFNEHFINSIEDIVQKAQENISPSIFAMNRLNEISIEIPFRCDPVTDYEIYKIISNLKNKMSSGHDEVPLKLLKYVKYFLLKPLVHLINCSFITGIFPESLKISKIVPIFKRGDKSDIGNYRPVSLLPSISKIYERVMHNRLVEHLINNNLFDKQQHGFQKGKSVTSALLDFTETIIDSIDGGNKVVGVFMDLSKAFDIISHTILLQKLKAFGLNKLSLDWFESYLFNRKQYVEITSSKDKKKH